MDSFDNIKRKNLLQTIYLAICFVLLFTAYSSAQNLMTQIYHQLGYGSLGLICFFCIYASFALSSLVSAHYHKKLPFKAELVYASSTYVLFILSGALVTFCNKYELDSGFCHSSFIYSASIIAALILGVGASFLWLGQATYVNACADEQSKGAFNGTFFSVFQFSQVISSLIATYVLGYADQFTFYVVLLAFATIATIMLSFIKTPVPYTNIIKEQQAIEPEESLKESVNTMFRTLKDQKYCFLFMAMIFAGIAPTFYSCSLGTIIASTVDSTNLNVVNQKTGMVFFVLAIAEVVAGGTIGYFADKYNKLKLLGALIIVNEIALFAELTASGFKSYWFGMLSGLIWGFGETAINTIINVIIGSRFNGRLELFACLRSLQSFGAVTAVTCSIMFLQASPVICIILVATILFVLQALFYHFYPREDSNESDYVRLKEEKIMVELKNM